MTYRNFIETTIATPEFKEGFDAYKAQDAQTACPHAGGTPQYYHWQLGWMAARNDAMEDELEEGTQ